MRAIDRAVFFAVNRWPDEIQPLMAFLSEGIKTRELRIALLLLLIGMALRGPKSRRAAVLAMLAWPLANGLTEALKTGFPMDRPSVDLSEALVRASHLTSSGTASSHSANMAAVALVFTYHLGWWWGAPWIAVAVLTGLSRIYMGVHYPSQVLLGWLAGLFCGVLVVKTWEAHLRQRQAARSRKDLHEPDPA